MHHHVPLYADNKKANIATTNVNKAVVYICRCYIKFFVALHYGSQVYVRLLWCLNIPDYDFIIFRVGNWHKNLFTWEFRLVIKIEFCRITGMEL